VQLVIVTNPIALQARLHAAQHLLLPRPHHVDLVEAEEEEVLKTLNSNLQVQGAWIVIATRIPSK
jgi:hypothetical protein